MWNNVTLRAYFDGGYVKNTNFIFVYRFKVYLFYCCKKDKKNIPPKITLKNVLESPNPKSKRKVRQCLVLFAVEPV